MPKKIDPKVKERCFQQMLEHVSEHVSEHPSPTAAVEAVAKRNGVATESARRWYVQAQVTAASAAAPRARSLRRPCR